MRDKAETIKHLKNLSQSDNQGEKQAAFLAIARLEASIPTKPDRTVGLTTEGPIFERIVSSKWRIQLLVALCLRFQCLALQENVKVQQPFRLVWNKKYYAHGMTEDARLVHSTFKSLEKQIEQEAKKYTKQKTSTQERFKEGLAYALLIASYQKSLVDAQDGRCVLSWSAIQASARHYLRSLRGRNFAVVIPPKFDLDSVSSKTGADRVGNLSLTPLIGHS